MVQFGWVQFVEGGAGGGGVSGGPWLVCGFCTRGV